MQAPLTQTRPEAQSPFVVHEVLQAPPEQAKGAQFWPEAGIEQVPLPSQLGVLRTVPWQMGEPHSVPEGWSWQAPAPLQNPVMPQLEAGWAVHSSSGSVLGGMKPQMPSGPPPFFAEVHAWQVPLQAESQQTPSTQKPKMHCEPVVHASPMSRTSRQAPPTHWKPGAQSLCVAQLVLQRPSEQAKGAQGVLPAAVMQLPEPLQILPSASLPLQVPPQGVPWA